MSILGCHFMYDGVYSQDFDLRIAEIYETPTKQLTGSLHAATQSDPRGTRHTLKGLAYEPYMFTLEIVSEQRLTQERQRRIGRWLFGRPQYRKLCILHPDYRGLYFHCILYDEAKYELVGADGFGCYGYRATVQCESPWAYEYEKEAAYTAFDPQTPCVFFNESDDPDYLLPVVEIRLGAQANDIRIRNLSDHGREVILTDLGTDTAGDTGETILLDSSQCTVESTWNRALYGHLAGKRFPRFLPGENRFTVEGAVQQLKIRYRNARKVGV